MAHYMFIVTIRGVAGDLEPLELLEESQTRSLVRHYIDCLASIRTVTH